MSWLTQLLHKSPFGPVLEHQRKVQQCAELVPPLVDACLAGNTERVTEVAKQLSTLEYEADQLKNSVRDSLPQSIFMPVSRADLLNVLSAQDAVADCAEDVGVLLTMRPMEPPPLEVCELLRQLVNSAVDVVGSATEVVERLEALVSASFAGPEAKRVLKLIDQVDRKEHLADKIQDQLAKAFFRHEDQFKPAAIFMWIKIFNKIGDLANYSERTTHLVRLFLAN